MKSSFKTILTRLRLYEREAVSELHDFARAEPSECAAQIRAYLKSEQHTDNVDISIELLEALFMTSGSESIEWILDEWPKLSPLARQNIAQAAYNVDSMPTDLAHKLFEHQSSSVRDRHIIAAGIASTAKQRQVEDMVMPMVFRIGTYDDPYLQAILESFIDNAKKSYVP